MAAGKWSTQQVLADFFDEGAYTELFAGEGAAVAAAFGLVGGQGAYAVCQNGGALAAADVKRARKTLKLAAKTGNPVVTFYGSTGAKLEEGLAAMKAATKLGAAVAEVSGVVPQISVVLGVCGASSALAAIGADLCVMADGAELYLSAPFLSAAQGDKVADAGSAKAAADTGVAAVRAKDIADAVAQAKRLVMLLPGNNLSAAASFEFTAPGGSISLAKYSGEAAVAAIADVDSAIELYKGFGGGVTTCLATVAGAVTGIVATNGPDTVLGPYCVARAARFMRLCDAYSIPVVTVLHTGGFMMSSSADEAGNMREAARLAATYADATTAKVAVLAGKAIGPIYTAMSAADFTVAMEGTVVAPAEPSAIVSVLYKEEIAASGNSLEAETAARAKVYEAENAGAAALAKAGLADAVVAPAALRTQVAVALDMLATKRTQRLPKKHGNMAL